MSVKKFFLFVFGNVYSIYWKKGSLSLFFSFSEEGQVFDKKNFGQTSLYSLLQHNPLFSCCILQAFLGLICELLSQT